MRRSTGAGPAACRPAGHEGPLHRCSFYGSEAVAERLWPVLETGSSRPWFEVLEACTGSPEMSAAPLLDYFAPLRDWLERRNAGRTCAKSG
ncbi:MAG: M2 family metallopeptidase [Alphaproteobacteria bacterium]